MGPLVNKGRRKRGNNKTEANAPPKVLRRDYDTFRPTQSTRGGKSLALMGLDAGSILSTPAAHDPSTATKSVSDPELLSYAKPQPDPEQDMAQSSKEAATEIPVEKVATTEIARRDQRIQVREEEIKKLDQEIQSLRAVESEVHGLQNQTKNLKTLLEAEVDMKKDAEAKNAELAKELDSLCVQFSDLQVSNNQLAKQVEQRCAKMDARLDKLSVDFDEELYPHMLTAIAGRRWVIGHGIRLAVTKCAESSEIRQAFANVVSAGLAKGMGKGLKYGIKHGKAGRDLADIEAYDPKANSKLVKALQDLKDLKYPMVDQLERLKDAPMELIMSSLHLESDTREDAPQ
ncbi:hypothetical protein Tco_0932777 [Tanacetum coccineum]